MDENTTWLPEIPEGLEPLSPNPGGPGEPDDLVGREQELARLHKAVLAGGAHVIGDRRMGKTWLVKKLQNDLKETVTAIYISGETSSLDVFTDRLLKELRGNRRVRDGIKKWEMEIGGEAKLNIGVAGLTLTAKATKAADQAPKQLDVLDLLVSQRVVLIIDEITRLCQSLGPDDAREFLSGLRSRRQSHGLPLIISGSIGLHHALPDFTPVNDLWEVKVGPLGRDEAVILAARLLLGIEVEPTPQLVADIVLETSAIPYYIQGVVDKLQYRKDLDSPTIVSDVVTECIADNSWDTEHYLTRLSEYYDPKGVACARIVLDMVAVSEKPVSIDALGARITASDPDLALTRDELLDLINNLEKDHYLARVGDADTMASPLLARIWRFHRRLG